MKSSLFAILLVAAPLAVSSWGFFGHQWINHVAVYTLPPEIFGLYKQSLHRIVADAVKPDMRRYIVEEEGSRHYIDIDKYERTLPLDTIRCSWKDATEKFGLDTLNEHGIGPWHVVLMKYHLTRAFETRDVDRIIRLSAELGHYVADLHVPLHTTSNYNGQKTGQHGIHGLWESRLPELFFHQYDLFVDSAIYIPDVLSFIWDQVEISHSLVDSVLFLEEKISHQVGDDEKYGYGPRGNQVIRNYSELFASRYHDVLNHMVERRMRDAIFAVGSIWFTAWVDAGQPVLEIDNDHMNEMPSPLIAADSLHDSRNMIGREE